MRSAKSAFSAACKRSSHAWAPIGTQKSSFSVSGVESWRPCGQRLRGSRSSSVRTDPRAGGRKAVARRELAPDLLQTVPFQHRRTRAKRRKHCAEKNRAAAARIKYDRSFIAPTSKRPAIRPAERSATVCCKVRAAGSRSQLAASQRGISKLPHTYPPQVALACP